MKKTVVPSSVAVAAEKPVQGSESLRPVPVLDKASVAFHRALTEKQEHFSLKSAFERFKKRTAE